MCMCAYVYMRTCAVYMCMSGYVCMCACMCVCSARCSGLGLRLLWQCDCCGCVTGSVERIEGCWRISFSAGSATLHSTMTNTSLGSCRQQVQGQTKEHMQGQKPKKQQGRKQEPEQ